MINIRWKNFDSILSQSKGRGHKNFPGGVPPNPPSFSARFARLWSRMPLSPWSPPCPTIASASLTTRAIYVDLSTDKFSWNWALLTFSELNFFNSMQVEGKQFSPRRTLSGADDLLTDVRSFIDLADHLMLKARPTGTTETNQWFFLRTNDAVMIDVMDVGNLDIAHCIWSSP